MNRDKEEKELVLQGGDAARVQKAQLSRAEEQAGQMRQALDDITAQGEKQDAALAKLMEQMDALESGLDDPETLADIEIGEAYTAEMVDSDIEMTKIIPLLKESSWEEYLSSVEWYAQLEHMDLSTDPYVNLLSKPEQDAFAKMVRDDFYERKPECDSVDYALAAFCGTVAGLVDIFLVGSPEDQMKNSFLGQRTDDLMDKIVILIAKASGWKPQEGNEQSVGHAISFLDRRAKVNYDFETPGRIGEAAKNYLKMTASNHHYKNLEHAPDLVGLIFSILAQFRGEAHFVDRGRIATFSADKQPLQGNIVQKVYAAFVNWLSHCISDVAGSSNTRKADRRGSGLPIPGHELFQFINIGSFNVGTDSKGETVRATLSELSVKVFENGYDLRFGLALSIPIVISEVLTRLCFALKRYFYHHWPMDACVPVNLKAGDHPHQPELRRMLLVAHGTLCAWDMGDAAVQYATSGGNVLQAALHLNYFAYVRLAQDGLAALRARWRQNHIDIKAITQRTQEGWDELYADAQKWLPASL